MEEISQAYITKDCYELMRWIGDNKVRLAEKEKQEKIEAFDNGFNCNVSAATGEEYYNQTYKKMTNVEELFVDIEKFGWKVVRDKVKFYKKKERQQIIDACIEFGASSDETNRERGEEYYNLIYKK